MSHNQVKAFECTETRHRPLWLDPASLPPTAATGVCASIRGKPAGPRASLVLLETGGQQYPYAIPAQYITNS